jgi:hypothetical protein
VRIREWQTGLQLKVQMRHRSRGWLPLDEKRDLFARSRELLCD